MVPHAEQEMLLLFNCLTLDRRAPDRVNCIMFSKREDPEFDDFLNAIIEVDKKSSAAFDVINAQEEAGERPVQRYLHENEIFLKFGGIGTISGATYENSVVLRQTFSVFCFSIAAFRMYPHAVARVFRKVPMPPLSEQLFNLGPSLVFQGVGAFTTSAIANRFLQQSARDSLYARLPLVPGASTMCKEMGPYCDETFQHVPLEFWGRYCGLSTASVRRYHLFYTNLRKRQACETMIRKVGGLGATEEVDIPWPGVNALYDRLVVEYDLANDEEVNKWVKDEQTQLKESA